MKEWLIAGLGQEEYKMSLEHSGTPESKEPLREDENCVRRIDQRLQSTDSRVPTNPKQDLKKKKQTVLKTRDKADKSDQGGRRTWKYHRNPDSGKLYRTNNPASLTNYT